MSPYLPLLLEDSAQWIYHWQQLRLYPLFPSPLWIGASRAVVRDACDHWSLPQPRVRLIREGDELFQGVGGLCHKTLDRIYYREWTNKAVVLHEIAHYHALKVRGGWEDAHGQEFIESFSEVIAWAGYGARSQELLEAWRSRDIA